jgi:hypothetical protein
MSKLSNIKQTGAHAYRFYFKAKRKAQELADANRYTYWVMSEPWCHTVLCLPEVEKLNKIFRKNPETKSQSKMNAVKLNKMARFIAHPKIIVT